MIVRQIGSLEKVLPTDDTAHWTDLTRMSALKGERISYQLAYTAVSEQRPEVTVTVAGDLQATVYREENVVCGLNKYAYIQDNDYLDTPLIPDALVPLTSPVVRAVCGRWRALWVTVEIPQTQCAAVYRTEVRFSCGNTEILKQMEFEVLDAVLPTQDLVVTQWIHCDCIADIHGVPIFSEAHWALMEKYVTMAAATGSNMVLTPVIGLCLDTSEKTERPTLQLADITWDGTAYSFDFSRLTQWIAMCRRAGIHYFEISHLFSQWGAKHAPKIMVYENGTAVKRFGIHTDSTSPEYRSFLKAYLSALTQYFTAAGMQEDVYFHVADEPSVNDTEAYLAAYDAVLPLLEGFKILDALGNYALHKRCAGQIAVPPINVVQKFIEQGVDTRWAYYCCGQGQLLPNKFLALPSARNRALGALLYKFDIEGFLHWGFNFYYSQFSRRLINPYTVTDADGAFPSGDAFVVYPFGNTVLYSMRALVFAEGLQDFRALRLLEQYKGRAYTMQLLAENGVETFLEYPKDAAGITQLRARVNAEIDACIKEK